MTADTVLKPPPTDWPWLLILSTLKPRQLSRKEHHDRWAFFPCRVHRVGIVGSP